MGEEQDSRGEGTDKHDGKDSNEADNADWEEGGAEEPEEPSEDVAPLPYQSVAEFGITTEDTAQVTGLQCLSGAELCVSSFAVEPCENLAAGGWTGFMHVLIAVCEEI